MSMTNIGLEGNRDPFARFKWTKVAVAFADEWGPKLLSALRREAPVAQEGSGSGRLRDALRFERRTSIGSLTMLFSDDVPYFDYVIKGTSGGQIIRPVATRALHWTNAGTDVFAKQVTRGDTPANDFPSRVWDRMREEVQNGFREKIREAMQ